MNVRIETRDPFTRRIKKADLPLPSIKGKTYVETVFDGLVPAMEITRYCDVLSHAEFIAVEIDKGTKGYREGEVCHFHAFHFVYRVKLIGSAFIHVKKCPPAKY